MTTSIKYRTTDLAEWGTGEGVDLTPAQVDGNFWNLADRLVTQEARPDPSAGIDYFSVDGAQFYVHMTDDTTVLGPYALPYALYNSRGDWAPLTGYSVLDTIIANGSLYAVIFAHTSEASFDAGANDGNGHDYYSLWLETPGNALPSGGAVGQVVQKSDTPNYAVTWGWKFPSSGSARKYLVQQSSTQDDAEWETPIADDIDFVPLTSSALSSSNVADALEELSGLIPSGDAIDVTYTPPTGSVLSALDVQSAIDEIEALLADIGGTTEGSYLASPTGNVSTTAKAMGLGGTFTFTPDASGILLVWMAGMVMNETAIGSGVTITGRYGTGTAPVNGATSGLGTQFSTPQRFVASTVAGQQGFTVMGKVTGLTAGVTYWFDLSIVAVTSGGATVKDVQFVAFEP